MSFHLERLHQTIVSEAPGQGWWGGVRRVHVSLRISSGAGDTQRRKAAQRLWTPQDGFSLEWDIFRFGKSELVPQPGWSKMLWHFDGIFYQILGADRKWWIPKTVAFLTNMLIHWMEGTQDFGNLQQIPWNPIKSPLNRH